MLLISASHDEIRRWDAATGAPLGRYPDTGSPGAFDLAVARLATGKLILAVAQP